MWKILLVEDEPFVRRSIRNAIPWESYGFHIVGEASHGREALELIREFQPDVILSDIIMPYMDGIELLQEARREGSEACFIMLTCANEFEYARLALEHGATSYILKLSMDDDQLVQALNKCKAQLSRRAERKEWLLRDSLPDRLPVLWKSIHGKELSAYEEEKLEEIHMAMRRYPRLIIVSVLNGSRPFGYEALKGLPAFAGIEPEVVLSYSCMGHTSVFLWGHMPVPTGFRRLEAAELTAACRTVSGEPSLGEAWIQNLRWLDGLYYGTEPGAGKTREKEAQDQTPAVPWEMEQEIIRLFEAVSLQACVKKLKDLWQYMWDMAMPMVPVKETAERLDKLFARICRKTAFKPDELHQGMDHGEVLKVLIRHMEQYAKGRSAASYPETDHPEVNKILRYLLQNYDKEISLQAMAHYVSMDENYLSGLFKKKTGETFINYLQHVRVNEAKFYLEQTDLTVAEIGERSGFGNPSYFFKIFKRWTGYTPSEYRTECKNRDRP